jgi:glycosyltransferase involved in cell wall biosynthesis
MKLLFILPEYPPHSGGGIATFYRHTLPEIVRQGHQVHVLVGSAFTSKLPSYQADGITIEFLDDEAVSANLSQFNRYCLIPEFQRHLAAAWTAWEQVNGGKGYDIVETTDWGMLFVPWIASVDSPPTVVQLHASIGQIDFHDPQLDIQLQSSWVRLLEAGLLAVSDELQTYSQSNALAWKELLNRDITYIPPALAASKKTDLNVKSSNGLVVGRIQYWKGPTILCEALRLLGEKAPTIDWIGRDMVYRESGTSMAAYLEQTYPDIWGLKVHPLGTFSSEETTALQGLAKFMIVPSTWDVFNYTCIEGMAQAQIIICSQGAGAADLINDGINGFTFAANDAKALAESLDALLSLSIAECEEMGKVAQQTILTKLAPVQIAQQRIQVYENLKNRGRFSVRPNSWLLNAVSPNQPLEKPLAFLDRLTLKQLSTYVLNRSLKKFIN